MHNIATTYVHSVTLSTMPLSHLRQQIDRTDREILERIARRLTLAMQTASLKNAVRDPGREEELRRLWTEEAEKLDISPEPCLAILRILIDESVRLQQSSH